MKMGMFRRLNLAAALLLAIVLLIPALPTPAAEDDVVFTGGGWGHGVGMSQWGAYGMAESGSTSNDILSHYYSGSSIGTISSSTVKSWLISETKPLWVGIMQNQTTVTFKPIGGTASLCFESGGSQSCLSETAADGETWRFRAGGGACVFEKYSDGSWAAVGSSGTCSGSAIPDSDSTILNFPGIATSYRGGILRLRQPSNEANTKIHAIWQIEIEDYVRGVNEVPDSWPTEALRAQVMASRSYALARAGWRGSASSLSDTRKDSCWCNLYSSTNDQVFKSWTAESVNTNFVALANATAGSIMVSGGKVAEAVYSSSSGGRSETNHDYWGGVQLPFLVSVDDSASQIPANPYASWTVVKTRSQVAAKLGFDTVTAAVVTERHVSGSAKTVQFSGTLDGQAFTTFVTSNWVKVKFGLRSWYFDISFGSPPTTTTTTATTTTPATATTTVGGGTTTTTTVPTTTTTTAPSATTTVAPSTTTAPPTTTEDQVVVMVAPPDEPSTQGGVVTNAPPPSVGAAEPLPSTEASSGQVVEVDWQLRLQSESPTPAFIAGIDFVPPATAQEQPEVVEKEPLAVVELAEAVPAQTPPAAAVPALELLERPPSSFPNAAGNVAHVIGYTLDAFSSGGGLPTASSFALPSLLLWMGWRRFARFAWPSSAV